MQALVSYMQNTREPNAVMSCLMRDGLEASDWRQRQATALFLSLPSTPLEGVQSLYRDLVRALCTLLTDQIDQVRARYFRILRLPFSVVSPAVHTVEPVSVRDVQDAAGQPNLTDTDATSAYSHVDERARHRHSPHPPPFLHLELCRSRSRESRLLPACAPQ